LTEPKPSFRSRGRAMEHSSSAAAAAGGHAGLEEQASDMIEAMTSLYIAVPALVACSASKTSLKQRSLFEQRAWIALLAIVVCALVASMVAWYRWNLVTGVLDQTLATLVITGSAAFGLMRGSRIYIGPFCLMLLTASSLVFFNRGALLQHGWRLPWPHFTFRYLACSLITCSLSAEVVYVSLREMLVAIAVLAVVSYSHVYAEMRLSETTPGWHWSQSSYIATVVRGVLPVMLCAYLMTVLPRKLCRSSHDAKIAEEISSCSESSDDEEDTSLTDDGGSDGIPKLKGCVA